MSSILYHYLRTRVEFICAGEHFSCTGQSVLSPGFTTVMPWLRIVDETLPTFSIGESIQIGEVELYQVLKNNYS